MSDAVELVKIMKKAAIEAVEASKPVNLCFGTVESVSPLKINVEQKMTLGEPQLILTGNVMDYRIKIAVDMDTDTASGSHVHSVEGKTLPGAMGHDHEFRGTTGEAGAAHNHRISGEQEIIIKNGLAAGEKVLLLRQQGGQKYFVLERIGI